MSQKDIGVLIVDTEANRPASPIEGVLCYTEDTNKMWLWTTAWVDISYAVTDGDKGDITVSGGGLTWTIDNLAVTTAKINDLAVTEGKIANLAVATGKIANDAVTFAKIQNINTDRVIGRDTALSGDAEELTASQVLDWVSTTRGALLERGAATWGAITPGTDNFVLTSNGAGADPTYQEPGGYALQVVAPEWAAPADTTVAYWGCGHTIGVSASTNYNRVYIPKSGTIVAAYLYGYAAGVAGTGEAWSMYLFYNGAAATLIQTTSAATAVRNWSNNALSIAVTQGNYLHIRTNNPTWATNPTNVNLAGSIWIR